MPDQATYNAVLPGPRNAELGWTHVGLAAKGLSQGLWNSLREAHRMGPTLSEGVVSCSEAFACSSRALSAPASSLPPTATPPRARENTSLIGSRSGLATALAAGLNASIAYNMMAQDVGMHAGSQGAQERMQECPAATDAIRMHAPRPGCVSGAKH